MGKHPDDIIDVIRFSQKDRKNRSFYTIVGEKEVICSIPSDARNSNDLLAVLTALTRMISIALQNGVDREVIKKQLRESCVSKGDLPDLILRSITRWEELVHGKGKGRKTSTPTNL